MNKIQTREFIHQKFLEYYRENIESIQPPTSLEKREFAVLLLKERAMLRHRGFKNVEILRDFLQSVVSSDVYYSSSYYEQPDAEEMDAKGWIGADLIFDIDADHIPTECDKRHDMWTCKSCGTMGRGPKPEKCPKCQLQKFSDITWPCEMCLESAKEETTKLIDMLEQDFGFSSNEMILAFSGHRGYHVHIEDEAVRTLDSMSRKEIVDYLMGIGLDPTLKGFNFKKGVGPKLEDSGWGGRIARGTYELLASSHEQLEKTGLGKVSATIVEQQEQILQRWKTKGPWGLVSSVRPDDWENIVRQAIERQSARIDSVVTTDVHRLIRLANTLHGGTGLKKTEIPISKIEGFDPFNSAVAFNRGTLLIDVLVAPRFRLGDNSYGPYNNKRLELPTAAAMLLLCKGTAKIAEDTPLVR